MRAVFWRECRHQFFSFRSVFFVFLFVVLGFSLDQLFALTSVEIGGIDNKTYAGSFYVIIKLAVMLLGYLFASILSHSSINRETERKSVRLVISKISRTEYVTGKFLANVMFWVICFVLIYGCLFLKYKVFDVGELITNTVMMIYYTIEKIIKLLRCAFKQAVRWELVAKNPFDNVVLPKVEYKKRDIWTADMIRTALDQCTDSKLYVAMNLAFACSLRMGEILGLTWSNVHISDEDIADDNAYVYIDKELARASKRAIEMLGQKDIYHVFTPLFPNTSTRIILKKPKTDSSIRKVWLPKTLAYILREWKSAQDELRALLRDEYQDYDLVVALANGRPCEDRIILKSFEKLREKAGLPKVVFHSLRHSSTTYKLKLNHGDLKATQGDTGHAQIDMITSVYAHILDEDRKINAQKFESAFYANPDLRSVRPPEEPKEPAPATLDLEALVEQLRKSPELANTLAALLASAPSEK